MNLTHLFFALYRYYNSRFDTADKLGGFDYPEDANDTVKYNYITKQALLIANLSSTLARYLYNASTGKIPTAAVLQNLTADPLMVSFKYIPIEGYVSYVVFFLHFVSFFANHSCFVFNL